MASEAFAEDSAGIVSEPCLMGWGGTVTCEN